MDRHRLKRRATVIGVDGRPFLVGLPWSIVGAGDFSENGVPDIVWHNSSTNETQIWFMGEVAADFTPADYNTITGRVPVVLGEDENPFLVGLPWSIVGAGDSVSGDEREILWHNSSTSETQIWFMERHRITGRQTVLGEDGNPAIVGLPWSIVGTSFFAPWVLGWV
jgi:hypothetical protein